MTWCMFNTFFDDANVWCAPPRAMLELSVACMTYHDPPGYASKTYSMCGFVELG